MEISRVRAAPLERVGGGLFLHVRVSGAELKLSQYHSLFVAPSAVLNQRYRC